MTKNASIVLASLFALSTLAVVAVTAPSIAGVKNYDRAINFAGMERMLTQKMSKESLLIALGIDKDQNLKNLQETRTLFANTLEKLRTGDVMMGLPETTEPEILKELKAVEQLWPKLDSAVQNGISASEVGANDVSAIAEVNMPVLKAMNTAVKAYESAAMSGDIPSIFAEAINLAGRQRMLTQKMTKEFLLIAYGHEVDKNKKSLLQTVELFESTLTALIEGSEELALLPAPTPQIEEQLTAVQGLWSSFIPLIKSAAEGKPDDGTISKVAKQNLVLLVEMNTAVSLYEGL